MYYLCVCVPVCLGSTVSNNYVTELLSVCVTVLFLLLLYSMKYQRINRLKIVFFSDAGKSGWEVKKKKIWKYVALLHNRKWK